MEKNGKESQNLIRKNQYQPYSEIIDLQAELKEYKKLCFRKSKKFTFYLEWKTHIIKRINMLGDSEKVENFKHYILNHKRTYKNFNSSYVTLMVFCLSLLFNKLIVAYLPDLDIISSILIITFVMFVMIKESNNNDKEYCFYSDLVDITEELQTKSTPLEE